LIQFGADKNAIDRYGETPKEVGECVAVSNLSNNVENHDFMRKSVLNFWFLEYKYRVSLFFEVISKVLTFLLMIMPKIVIVWCFS
jgi:hypothetical protein